MTPARHITRLFAILVALMALGILFDWGCTAHAGQLSKFDSSRPSLRRLRRETRITVLKPVRAHGRARAGYPMLQTMANTSRAVANVTGLLNPLGWLFR